MSDIYRSDSREAIEQIFSMEGDKLERSGFKEPDLSFPPEYFPADTNTNVPDSPEYGGQQPPNPQLPYEAGL